MPQGKVIEAANGWIKVMHAQGFADFYVAAMHPSVRPGYNDIVSFDVDGSGMEMKLTNLQLVSRNIPPQQQQPGFYPVLNDPVLQNLNLETGTVQCSRMLQSAIQTPVVEYFPFTFATWNIGHVSDDTSSGYKQLMRNEKMSAIKDLPARAEADIVVLQEVRRVEDLQSSANLFEYNVEMGPLMNVVGTQYNPKDGTQYEHYPVIYTDRFILQGQRVLDPELKSGEVTTATYDNCGTFEWTRRRPLVVYEFLDTLSGLQFALGVVHTSPNTFIARDSAMYMQAMAEAYPSVPWVLGGDWYVKEEKKFQLNGEKDTWNSFVNKNDGFLALPEGQTNYPHKGKGMKADYFIPSNQWQVIGNGASRVWSNEEMQVDIPEHLRTGKKKAAVKGVSDHVPVKVTLQIPVKNPWNPPPSTMLASMQ